MKDAIKARLLAENPAYAPYLDELWRRYSHRIVSIVDIEEENAAEARLNAERQASRRSGRQGDPDRTITFDGKLFEFCWERDWSYEDKLVYKAIKNIPGRRFDGDRKCWTAPADQYDIVMDIAEEFNFTVSAEAMNADGVVVTYDRSILPGTVSGTFRVSWELGDPMFGRIKDKVASARRRKFQSDPSPHWVVEARGERDLFRDLIDNYDFQGAEHVYSFYEGLEARMKEEEKLEEARYELTNQDTAEIPSEWLEGFDGTPREFQKVFLKYAEAANGAVILGDDRGLGKTIQALLYLNMRKAYPSIVVCPSIVKRSWARHVLDFLPGRTVSIWEGTNFKKKKPITIKTHKSGDIKIPVNSSDVDVIVINYDILYPRLKELCAIPRLGIVFDEAHRLKSHEKRRTSDKDRDNAFCPSGGKGDRVYKVKRTQAAKVLTEGIRNVLLLTGTALKNRPIELASLLDMVGRLEDFGGFQQFAVNYAAAYKGKFGWDYSGASNLSELNEALRKCCYIGRKKTDVAKDIPPKTRYPMYVTPDNIALYNRVVDLHDTMQEYNWIIKDLEKQMAEASAASSWAGGGGGASLQFMGYIQAYQDMKKRLKEELVRIAGEGADTELHLARLGLFRRLSSKGKLNNAIDFVDNFLKTTDEKIIVFCHYRDTSEAIARRFNAPMIIGGVSDAKREKAMYDFQTNPKTRVIVGNIVAAGEGVTLTAANTVLFVELPWSPGDVAQGEDRAHRIGQTNPVSVYFLVAQDTIDAEVWRVLQAKERIMEKSLFGVDIDTQRPLSTADLELFEAGKDGQENDASMQKALLESLSKRQLSEEARQVKEQYRREAEALKKELAGLRAERYKRERENYD
jgi:SWI/SNF-related matrix-associated actin-dependent regulator 1 of chromatin subfamily A